MPDTELTPISFSFYWTDELGEEIKKRALEQCPDGYRISTPSIDEAETYLMAWNQAIDSYLEAMTEQSVVIDTPSRFTVLIHPEELHTLVRRLMNLESGTQYDNLTEDLTSSICSTLGIELI